MRRGVGEALGGVDAVARTAAMMAASELLENAVKYGEEVPTAPSISFAMSADDHELWLEVSNGATDMDGVRELERRLDQISRAPDKAALYMGRLEELLEHPTESGKLGLYRIAFEGQFDMSFSYANDVVTVTAVRIRR